MSRIGALDRYAFMAGIIVLFVVSLGLLALSGWAWLGVVLFGLLSAVGVYDLVQTRHAILRTALRTWMQA